MEENILLFYINSMQWRKFEVQKYSWKVFLHCYSELDMSWTSLILAPTAGTYVWNPNQCCKPAMVIQHEIKNLYILNVIVILIQNQLSLVSEMEQIM